MNLDTFFDNFGLLAEAPNGVQKLREMVLQLAVQGKLVPQDPKDEPASVLLEKIKAEKKQLIKKTKNKKSKPLPPIQSHAISHDLPESWVWVRTGDLLELEYGKGLPKETKNESGNVPVYGANGIKRYYKEAYTKEPSIIVGRKGSAGAVNKVYKPCWPLDVTFFIQPSKFLDFEFIFELLKSLSLEKLAKGIKPGLNRNEVYNLPIGLPPFNEQKRIVAKVNELMALCDELEASKQKVSTNCIQLNDASIHKLLTTREPKKFGKHWQRICDNFDLLYSKPENVNKLHQAILQLAVQGKLVPQDPKDEPASVLLEKIKAEKERLIKEKKIKKGKPLPPIEPNETPYKLPDGWEWVRLGNVANYGEGGKVSSNDIPEDAWLLDLADIEKDTSRIVQRVKFRDRISKSTKAEFKKGDVLYGKLRPYLNKVVVADDKGFCTTEIIPFRGYSGVSPKYLMYSMRSPRFLEYVNSKTYGTKMPRLGTEDAKNSLFPLPPTNEQKRIVAKVDELIALCDELETSLSKSQTDCNKLMEAAVAEILAA